LAPHSLGRGRFPVRFDRRGVGASQRDVDDFSLQAHVADVAAVVDHLRLKWFDVLAGEDSALETLGAELEQRRRGDPSELMDILTMYRWTEALGPFARDPVEIVWKQAQQTWPEAAHCLFPLALIASSSRA
jgi:hypothetical protein